MFAEGGNSPREGGRCVYLMISFNLRVFVFWFVRYNIIPGNFGLLGIGITSML